tara:strand:- start:77 stop:523 length:447 start_codon:yes stop_codon:yes gene_type:complete
MFNANLSIRKRFLKGTITEEIFKKEIQKKEKKRQKALNIKQIYQTFITVCNDTFTKIVNTRSKRAIIDMLNQVITFINHINKQLINHRTLYSCVTYQFIFQKEKQTIYGQYFRNEGRRQTQKINVININHNSYKQDIPMIVDNKLFTI